MHGDDGRRQVNTRLPRTLVAAVDTRRESLGLSRDEWMRRALRWVLETTSGDVLDITARRTVGRRPPF